MQFKLLLILTAFIQFSFASYSCYTSPDATTPPTNVGYVYSGIGGQCSSYQYTCSYLYNATCTSTEMQSSTVKWAYTYFTQSSCDQMYADPTFANVCCCNTDSCNSPSLRFGCNVAGVPNNSSVSFGQRTTGTNSTVAPVSNSVSSLTSFKACLSSCVVVSVMLLLL